MKRYPGIRPFRTDEQTLFFGRDTDIDRLYRLIELEQLVILYGKSGYGKSSLLSAGIFPRLQAEDKRRFWEIRFGPYKAGESQSPAEVVRHTVARHAAAQPPVPDALAGPSLWQALKNCQPTGKSTFLLVFDQFEELFSYPQEQILAFKKQLAEALYAKVPKRYEAALADAPLSLEQEDAVYTPFDLKVVFSIRSDRMSLLNGLKDYLPNLLQHGYALDALDEAGAREAILRPAGLRPEGEGWGFDTPPFTYAPETQTAIFNALRDDHGRIETSALQIVCRYVEDYLVGEDWPKAKSLHVEVKDLSEGDIKSIFRQFYERTIANLPQTEQAPARRLVEDQLVKDGVRVPYAAQALLAQPGITQDLLDRLSNASLLRVQRDEAGRMIYEVGHDTLVGPIEEAAKARREAELQAAERTRLEQEAARQQAERQKITRARRRNAAFTTFAILLLGFAIWQTYKAGKQQELTEAKTVEAERADSIAQAAIDTAAVKTRYAELKEKEATDALTAAEAAEFRALQEQAKANAAKAEVAGSLLKDAETDILHLDFAAATEKLLKAAELGVRSREIGFALLEPAFWYVESDQPAKAAPLLFRAARLLGKPAQGRLDTRAGGQKALQALDGKQYGELQRRYYPRMLPIPAGRFWMGCYSTRDENCSGDEYPRHEVELSAFRLAETETTMRQFGLYCAAEGLDINDFHEPSWELRGDAPVIYVSWYQAILYANWLSEAIGLEALTISAILRKEKGNRTLLPSRARPPRAFACPRKRNGNMLPAADNRTATPAMMTSM